jgi:hypothetical protein
LGSGRLAKKLSKLRLHLFSVLMEERLTGEKGAGILIDRGGMGH